MDKLAHYRQFPQDFDYYYCKGCNSLFLDITLQFDCKTCGAYPKYLGMTIK